MDSKNIDILLERYWNCTSTVEEENELKKLFEDDEVAKKYPDVAPLFRYYKSQSNVILEDEKFEQRIINQIDKKPETKVVKMESNFQNYLKVAAVVVIVIAGSIVFRNGIWQGEKPPVAMVEDTFNTPEEAYEETKRAFALIASKMNQGRNETEKIKILSEAEDKIKNN